MVQLTNHGGTLLSKTGQPTREEKADIISIVQLINHGSTLLDKTWQMLTFPLTFPLASCNCVIALVGST